MRKMLTYSLGILALVSALGGCAAWERTEEPQRPETVRDWMKQPRVGET